MGTFTPSFFRAAYTLNWIFYNKAKPINDASNVIGVGQLFLKYLAFKSYFSKSYV